MIYTTKDQFWADETGHKVSLKYITPSARLRERNAAAILKNALSLNKSLIAFKKKMNQLCDEAYAKTLEELNARGSTVGKGNFNWFNFDRSIKIEVSISDRITFDDLTIKASKEEFDLYLDEKLKNLADNDDDFFADIVRDTFATTKGNLDVKKVLSIMKYKNKVQNQHAKRGFELITEAIRRPDSKRYSRVFLRQEDNSYKLIDLNFSSI